MTFQSLNKIDFNLNESNTDKNLGLKLNHFTVYSEKKLRIYFFINFKESLQG